MSPAGPLCLLLLLLLLLAGASGAAALFTGAQERQVEEFVHAAMDCFNTTGLTVAVVKGNASWTRGFGQADVQRGVNVTSSTLFGIGSLSKAFTATLLAMALNGSQYTWQTPVHQILGDKFELANEELTRETTIRDLLSHRTGLQAANMPVFAGVFGDESRAAVLSRLQFLEPTLPFRDQFLYNNWMYTLAGLLVSELSGGQSWEEVLRTRLLEPLGMRSSRVIGKTVEVTDDVMAKPYHLRDGQLELTDPEAFRIHPQEPAGAVASSADDMARWMHFLLRQGKTEANQSLVDATLLQDCFQAVVAMEIKAQAREKWRPKSPVTNVNIGYGYAWLKAVYRGLRMIWHSGGLHSYVSFLHLFPDQDLAVFASQSGPYMKIISNEVALFLADLLLGETPQQNHTSICAHLESATELLNRTSSGRDDDVMDDVIDGPLQPYLGTYRHGLLGDVSILPNAAEDGLHLQYGRMEGSLNRTNGTDSFKLFLTGPLSFLSISPSPNQTISFPVQFGNFTSGRFVGLRVTDSLSRANYTFYRDVPSVNKSATLVSEMNVVLALVISLLISRVTSLE